MQRAAAVHQRAPWDPRELRPSYWLYLHWSVRSGEPARGQETMGNLLVTDCNGQAARRSGAVVSLDTQTWPNNIRWYSKLTKNDFSIIRALFS